MPARPPATRPRSTQIPTPTIHAPHTTAITILPADASDNVPFDQLASALSRPATHPDAEGSGDCLVLAARDSSGVLSSLRFARRALGPDGVRIQIAFCGICHSGGFGVGVWVLGLGDLGWEWVGSMG